MAKKSSASKKTRVRAHPWRVKPSQKNPSGVTIVDEHSRRLPGTYLDEKEIYKITNGYSLKKILNPSSNPLNRPDENKYNDLIGIWTHYFNNLFAVKPPLDPDMIKALIGSESDFRLDPKNPDIAIPVAIRWLAYKKYLAEKKLGHTSNHEDIILEYKGLLKSKTLYKGKALEKYREFYGKLKK